MGSGGGLRSQAILSWALGEVLGFSQRERAIRASEGGGCHTCRNTDCPRVLGFFTPDSVGRFVVKLALQRAAGSSSNLDFYFW